VGVYLRDTGLAYLGMDMVVLGFLCLLLAALNYLLLKKEGL